MAWPPGKKKLLYNLELTVLVCARVCMHAKKCCAFTTEYLTTGINQEPGSGERFIFLYSASVLSLMGEREITSLIFLFLNFSKLNRLPIMFSKVYF